MKVQPTTQQLIAMLYERLPELFDRPQRQSLRDVKPLTDEEFLELILRTGTQELVGVATFVGGSIQMQGKIGLLRSAKIIKEFVEEAHGIYAPTELKEEA